MHPNRTCKRKQSAPECDSAIGQHLLENDQCAANYNDDQFSILDTARSLFHVSLVTTASLPSETDIYESPDLASHFHFDAITHGRVRHEKLLGQTAFFKATPKELWLRVS